MELSVGSPTAVAVGIVLVLLGATGATVATRGFDGGGPPWRVLTVLIPFGVLIGGGASLVRGWDLGVGVLVGAIAVPIVGALARMVEVRRYRARRDRRP